MISKLTFPVACLFLSPLLPAAVLSTIGTTGYNQDVVVEAGLTPTATGFVNASFGSRAFFQNGAYGATGGLQATSTVAFGGDTVNFNFQTFAGNNALNVGSSASTLTVSTPALFSTLGFVSSSSVAAGTNSFINYTVNYATGAALTGSFSNTNWNASETETGTSDTFLTIAGRAAAKPVAPATANGAASASTEFQNTLNEGQSWRIYLYEVAVDPTRQVTSVSFTSGTAGTDNKVFGIVGAAVPEPSGAALGVGAMALGLLRRRRD